VPFSDTRGCSRSEACASCSLARRRAACHPFARRRRSGHREARGRSMQVRPGKIAFHGATFTSVTRSIRTCGVDSSARGPSSPPLTSLSPPPRLSLVDRVAIDARARRPPRSVPRGPRERRALLRPEMPSIARSFSATTRAEARADRGAFVEMRRSRDEDCRLSNEPSSLRLEWPWALARFRSQRFRAGWFHLWLGPRPPASCFDRAFDPFAAEGALL